MTRVRIVSINDVQFLTCLRHDLWGAQKARFGTWATGDYVLFKVGSSIACLAQVTGEPFHSEERIWDDTRIFPNRVPIAFACAFLPEKRPAFDLIRQDLTSAWGGPRYGLKILAQLAVEGSHAENILAIVESAPNDLPTIRRDFDAYLAEARSQSAQPSASHISRPMQADRH